MVNGDGREFVWKVGGSNRYPTRYVSSLNLARRWLAAVGGGHTPVMLGDVWRPCINKVRHSAGLAVRR